MNEVTIVWPVCSGDITRGLSEVRLGRVLSELTQGTGDTELSVHRTSPHLIESLVLAAADPFIEGFDPGFLLLPTGCLELDVADLQGAWVGEMADVKPGSHLGS